MVTTELILHLGASKCSSTFIQSVLRNESVSQWLANEDCKFIENGTKIWEDMSTQCSDTYSNLWESTDSFDAIGDDTLDGYCQQIHDDASQAGMGKVILSQEGFSDLLIFHPAFRQRFVDRVLTPLKQTFTVRVILFIRRQDQFVESFFSHVVKRGYGGTLEQFLRILPLAQLSWKNQVNIFKMVSSSNTVELIPFVPKIMQKVLGKNVAGAFLSKCGWDINIENNEQIINPSSAPDLLEVMSFVNRTLPHDRAVEINQFLSVNFPKVPGDSFDLLPLRVKSELAQLFDQENLDLLNTQCPMFPSDCLSIETVSAELGEKKDVY
jgi:hypothetical protein